MFHKDGNRRRTWKGRAFSLFLSAALLLGSVPGLVLPASAHWADSYLDQLVDWGVMRADQISNPDTPLTRAEFMAIINRAYGYQEMGEMPFTDVAKSDWFYDDVAIAYNAGYMKGTSKTTASPNARLTREQAICILGRNMMLKETPGEDLAFSDSRDISGWARGMVKTAVNNYIVTGYPDDSFRPKSNITKGQMAVLVTQCVGTPVNASGTYELGDVSGNVTVTSPNVTLRNTTVSGDLYVSGGVGLGGIKLENVNVLGRIVVSGTGESENGSASVIMRNVNANELLVDNMRKKYVTVRADGITEIPRTIVRTNAYLEDNNTDDKGLLNISLEGTSGTRLDLAGRIKNVVDKTPDSFIQVAKGTVQSITVDEAATNSVIQINRNTEVKELNLDVAANVNGEGDVGKLNINAPGSTVTMLPDEIYIRPGITGNVNGVVMDSAAAEESSLDPRLLSGYPAASDVAPTGFRADFAGNKKGTVYWAVSDIADGSIGAEDLISPPSYGSKAVRGGSVGVPAGDTVGSTQISGLTVGGSYYLSAVLVDGRGERSPVKVISFTTPDNTVPAFAQGYPYMSLVSNTMAQVTVMPTKTCKLYYAVLLRGAPAPTASELRSASVTGNLGYGIVDVVKNTERVINVSNRLQELKDYTLYLWLTDADGVNSSAVVPVQFRTVDRTAPEFDPDPDPDAAVEENTSVRLTAGLNEQGTIYWVAVPKGRAYPPVNPGSDPIDKDNIMSGADILDKDGNVTGWDPNAGTPVSSRLTSEYAKNQVKNHRGSVTAFGSVPVPNADTEVNIDVRNLKEATAYDFYYVAQDQAGNFSKEVKMITIKTRDTVGPVVTQYFRDTTRGEAVAVPRSSDEVVLKFNEDIKVGGSESLLDLYNNKKTTDLKKTLDANFKLYYIDDRGTPVPVGAKTTDGKENKTWVDYSKAVVRKVDDGIEVALDPAKGAVKLVSGEEYYFELAKITDLSDNPPKDMTAEAVLRWNTIERTEHVLPKFTVAPASVKLSEPSVNQISVAPVWVANPNETTPINSQGKVNGGKKQGTGTDAGKELARMDGRFYVDPESTSEMGDTYYYDIVLFSEKAMDYDVYYRVLDPKDSYSPLELKPTTPASNTKYFDDYRLRADDTPDDEGWAYLGNVKSRKTGRNDRDVSGLNRDAARPNNADSTKAYTASIDNLKLLKTLGQDVRYEFAISVTKLGDSTKYENWGDRFNVHVGVIAGAQRNVDNVIKTGSVTEETITAQPGISVISDPFHITMDFDQFEAAPVFTEGPEFEGCYAYSEEDGTPYPTATIKFGLNNPGTLYYAIVPKGTPLTGTEIKMKKDVGDTTATTPTSVTIKASTGTGTSAVQTTINSSTTVTGNAFTWPTGIEAKDKTWQNLLWAAVSAQTGLKAPGKLDSDGDQEYYKVTVPDKTAIATQDTETWLSYTRTDKKTETMTLNWNPEEMEEGKEYFIYIVLASNNSDKMSKVYLYNFISGVAEKPKLLVNQNLREFTVETNRLGTPNVEADLRWRIFHRDNAMTVLNKDFTAYGSDINTKYPDVSTILDALTTTFDSDRYYSGSSVTNRRFGSSYDGFSVFDVLAGNTDRRTVHNLLNGTTSGVTVYGGDDEGGTTRNYSWKKNWYNIVQSNHPEENIEKTEYLILVGGYDHQLSQAEDEDITVDKYSFRALPVDLGSKSAPVLEYATGGINLQKKEEGTGADKKVTWELSGTISLQFEPDKPVYWKQNGDSNYYRVTGGNSRPGGTGDSASVGLLYNLDWGHPFTSAAGGDTYFTLRFEGFTGNSGTYTLLPGQGFFAKDGNDPGGPLVVKFTISPSRTEIDSNDPTKTLKYREGTWEVTYRTNGVTRTVGSETVKVYEDDAGTAKPTPPRLASASVQFSGSVAGSNSEADITLNFDKIICKKSGTGDPPRIKNIVTADESTTSGNKNLTIESTGTAAKPVTVAQTTSNGTVYKIKVSGIAEGTSDTITLLSETDMYEETGAARTFDKVWIVVSIVDSGGKANVKLPHIEVYFGNTQVASKTDTPPSTRRS